MLSFNCSVSLIFCFFFFNDTATTEIYTLSLHDALPISPHAGKGYAGDAPISSLPRLRGDRKSTRLNSSHGYISYAVFCLKKKKNKPEHDRGEKKISSLIRSCSHITLM